MFETADPSTRFASQSVSVLVDSQHPAEGCGCGNCLRDGSCARSTDRLGQLEPGQVLGSYRIVSLLREGGMGRVYIAEHVLLGRQVALKVLRPQYSANRHAVARFFAEARAVNRISHENIVEITDFCENGDGPNYLIMELLRGQDLGDLLLKLGVVPIHRAVDLAIQVAGALTVVHAGRIIHRDLKPDNIYLIDRPSRIGFVKLLDFGVAKLSDPCGEGIQLGTTAEGQIIGTPEYMSPEQATGDVIDHRSDIFSLGVILYEMVTGVLPFHAANFGELVVQLLTVEPVSPRRHVLPHEVPARLEQLILHMLAKKAADRPQSMSEIEERLRAIQDDLMPVIDDSTSARSRRGTDRTPTLAVAADPEAHVVSRPRRSSRKLLSVAVVTVCAAIASAGWYALPESAGTPTVATATATPPPSLRVTPSPVQALPPTHVAIQFLSTPSGARVRAMGSDEVLGVTPFSYRVERGETVRAFRFDLGRYAPSTHEVEVSRDGAVEASLVPTPPKRRVRNAGTMTPPTNHHVDRNSTMKVFE